MGQAGQLQRPPGRTCGAEPVYSDSLAVPALVTALDPDLAVTSPRSRPSRNPPLVLVLQIRCRVLVAEPLGRGSSSVVPIFTNIQPGGGGASTGLFLTRLTTFDALEHLAQPADRIFPAGCVEYAR